MRLIRLVDGTLGEIVILRLELQGAEGLFVLGNVLAEHVPECLGLLRAQVDGLVIADGDLVGAFAGGKAEHELKIPYTNAHLDAVGIGLAVIRRLGEVELGLCGWTHNSTRLLRRGRGALGRSCFTSPAR